MKKDTCRVISEFRRLQGGFSLCKAGGFNVVPGLLDILGSGGETWTPVGVRMWRKMLSEVRRKRHKTETGGQRMTRNQDKGGRGEFIRGLGLRRSVCLVSFRWTGGRLDIAGGSLCMCVCGLWIYYTMRTDCSSWGPKPDANHWPNPDPVREGSRFGLCHKNEQRSMLSPHKDRASIKCACGCLYQRGSQTGALQGQPGITHTDAQKPGYGSSDGSLCAAVRCDPDTCRDNRFSEVSHTQRHHQHTLPLLIWQSCHLSAEREKVSVYEFKVRQIISLLQLNCIRERGEIVSCVISDNNVAVHSVPASLPPSLQSLNQFHLIYLSF